MRFPCFESSLPHNIYAFIYPGFNLPNNAHVFLCSSFNLPNNAYVFPCSVFNLPNNAYVFLCSSFNLPNNAYVFPCSESGWINNALFSTNIYWKSRFRHHFSVNRTKGIPELSAIKKKAKTSSPSLCRLFSCF